VLQLLPSADETHECHTTKANTKTTRSKKRKKQRRRTWKTRHAGPPWIRSASFSTRLSEAP
jgi:hypothetical protein